MKILRFQIVLLYYLAEFRDYEKKITYLCDFSLGH